MRVGVDRTKIGPRGRSTRDARRGAATLDYVLVLVGIILPVMVVVLPLSQRIIVLVYEMLVVQLSWPFL